MDKKAYIIEVATALFRRKGYMGVGLSELLQACEISKGAFYHYFPLGKEQLLITCLEALSYTISQDMKAIFGTQATTQEALTTVIDKLVAAYDKEGTIASYTFTSIVSEMGALSEKVRMACERVYDEYERIIASKLEREGMPPDEARQNALLIIATLEGGIMLSLTRKTSAPLRVIAQQLGSKLITD